MSSNITSRRLGGFDVGTRKKNDFYPTPDYAIDAILDRVEFTGVVWEPSCGDGVICHKLIDRGYIVKATDLFDQGYGETGRDFLLETEIQDNIMTNPPFSISTEYVLKALKLARKQVLILNKLTFLEGKARRDKIFSQKKLKNVYVFSNRLQFDPTSKSGGVMAFAWFLFDNEYNGETRLEWI